MEPRYRIASDPTTLTISVGPKNFDTPHLWRLSERDAIIKAAICGEAPWDKGPKAAYQFYASFLGAKFNRRFQAANYWMWLGNRFSSKTADMLRMEGRWWQRYHEHLVFRTKDSGPYIVEAERDNLWNLIPLIVAFSASPQEIRRQVGGGAWRRAANNSISRNRLLMQAIERGRKPNERPSPELFVRLLEFPSGVVRGVMGATDDEVIAARICFRKRVDAFHATEHLVRDTRRMTGARFNPFWSLARMEWEHRQAVRDLARKRYSSNVFAPAWSFEDDGFRAALLTSEVDIAVEGDTQHHCVASYAKMAAKGQYLVFRIEGKERATAGATLRGGRLNVDQIYGACNRRVSEDCEAFVHRMKLVYAKRYAEVA